MLIGRGAGGPKQSNWKKDSKKAFSSYFGKRSGGESLPAGPPDAAESDVETAVELASVELNGSEWRRRQCFTRRRKKTAAVGCRSRALPLGRYPLHPPQPLSKNPMVACRRRWWRRRWS